MSNTTALRLAKTSEGRILLHLECMRETGHMRSQFHIKGIMREISKQPLKQR
jgi:hypothetical protein